MWAMTEQQFRDPKQRDVSYYYEIKLFDIIYLSTELHMPYVNEPVHEISNVVVYATSKASDQPAHTRSLIRAFASRWSIL